MNENYIAQAVGTGAVIDVYCGFKPGRVRVINTASANIDTLDWIVGMANASAVKTAGNVRTVITTNGITVLESATLGFGFRIGADAAVNIAGQAITTFAERGGEGNQAP